MIAPIRVLSESQVERFRKATEELLEGVGFRVMNKNLLGKARLAGAQVDDADNRVRLPASLLHDLLAQVPKSYCIAGLDGTECEIGGAGRYLLAVVTDPWIIDYGTQRPRRPCLNDVRRHTRIAQLLPQVAVLSLMDFPVTDFEGPHSSLHAREEYVLTHGKHFYAMPSSTEDLRCWLEIGNLLAQGSGVPLCKLMTVAVGVVSPLTLAGANAEHLLMACEWNLPVVPMVCPSAGTTSPYSLASTLLQANAETVFVAALTQMVRPGNPVQYATGLSVAEMTTGADRYYSIDKVLWKTAAAQLGLSYNLPTGAEFGGTLNPRYDVQSGAEGMLFALSAYASGAHLLCGLGSCYNAIGISAEMMIIQTAWLEVAKFLGRGIETDDARLGLESLTKGGPGACFLADDLTLRFLRGGEFFCSELFDFTAEPGDGEPMLVRAHNKVEELLTSYRCPVPEKVREDIHCYFGNLYEQVGK